MKHWRNPEVFDSLSSSKINAVKAKLIGDSALKSYGGQDDYSESKNTLTLVFGRPLTDDDFNYDDATYTWAARPKKGLVKNLKDIIIRNMSKYPDIESNVSYVGGYIWNPGRGDSDICVYVKMNLDYFMDET